MTSQNELLKFGRSLSEVEADFKRERFRRLRSRSMLWVTVALLTAAGADFFITREHGAFFWDTLPGFNTLYGLASVIVLVRFSAALGNRFLMKHEPDHTEE
jgi:hypothetical protein